MPSLKGLPGPLPGLQGAQKAPEGPGLVDRGPGPGRTAGGGLEALARLGDPARPIDLAEDPAWHDLFYGTVSPHRVEELGRFLRSDPNRFIRLYHGTSAAHLVMEKGLLPSAPSRAKSLQSAPGFVCLSVYPGMAEDFARMAYPGHPLRVYAVTLCVRRLRADLDQLRNRRAWGNGRFDTVGQTLAESLVFGHGARVRGKIEPQSLTLHHEIPRSTP